MQNSVALVGMICYPQIARDILREASYFKSETLFCVSLVVLMKVSIGKLCKAKNHI